jgi:citrate synthase
MIVMEGQEYLTAQEACQLLDIKAATLYAYVSRGLLSSYRQGIKRTRLYLRSEVERLTRLQGPGLPGLPSRQGASPNRNAPASDHDGPWIPYV